MNIYTPKTNDKVEKRPDRLSRFRAAHKTKHGKRPRRDLEQLVFDVWTKPLGPVLVQLTGGNLGPTYLWPESVKGKPVNEWTPDDVEQFGETGKSLAVLYHLRDVALEREMELDWLKTDKREDKPIAPTKLKLTPAANAVQNVIDTIRNHQTFDAVDGYTDLHKQMAEMASAAYLYDDPEKMTKYVEEVSSLGENGWQVDWELSNDFGTVFTNKNPDTLPNVAWRGSEAPTKNIRDWGKNVVNALGYENLAGSARKHLNNVISAIDFTGAIKKTQGYTKLQSGFDFVEKQNLKEQTLQRAVNEKYGDHTNSGHSRGGATAGQKMRDNVHVKKSYAFNSAPFEGMEALGSDRFESWTVEGDVVSAAHQESNHRKGLNRQIKPRLGNSKGGIESHKLEHFTGNSVDGPTNVSELLPENPNLYKKVGGSVVRGVANTGIGVGKGIAAGVGADFILNKVGLSAENIGVVSHVGLVGSVAETLFRGTKGIVSAAPSAFGGAVAGFEVNELAKDWNPAARATTSASAAVLAQRLGVAGTSVALEGAGALLGGEIGAGIASLAAETSLLGPMGWVGAALEVGIGSALMFGFNSWEDHERAVAKEKQVIQRKLNIKKYVNETEGLDMDIDDHRIDDIIQVYDRTDLAQEEQKLEYLRVLYPEVVASYEKEQQRQHLASSIAGNARALHMNQLGFTVDQDIKYDQYIREQQRERDQKALEERRKADAAYERTHTVKDADGVEVFRSVS